MYFMKNNSPIFMKSVNSWQKWLQKQINKNIIRRVRRVALMQNLAYPTYTEYYTTPSPPSKIKIAHNPSHPQPPHSSHLSHPQIPPPTLCNPHSHLHMHSPPSRQNLQEQIQYHYSYGKRKAKGSRGRKGGLCEMHRVGSVGNGGQNRGSRVLGLSQFRFQNVGKICRNVRKYEDDVNSPFKYRHRCLSEADLRQSKTLKKAQLSQLHVDNQRQTIHNQLFDGQKLGKFRKNERNTGYQKYDNIWECGGKNFGIEIAASPTQYQITIKTTKKYSPTPKPQHPLNPTTNIQPLQSPTIPTPNSNSCPHRIHRQKSLPHLSDTHPNINMPIRKSTAVGVSTSTQDLATLYRSRTRMESQGIQSQYYFSPNCRRKRNSTVLTDDAIVEEVNYLRNLALRLYTERAELLTKMSKKDNPTQQEKTIKAIQAILQSSPQPQPLPQATPLTTLISTLKKI